MKLYDNYRDILRRSWSLRFILLAGVLSGIEAVLPFFVEDIDRNVFTVLSFIFVCAAFVARLIAQRGI